MVKESMDTDLSSASAVRVRDMGDLQADSASELYRLRILLAEMMVENQRLRNDLHTLSDRAEAF